jgi:hypothetical protein
MQSSIQNLPGFSEEDLSKIYEDLLALPTSDPQESVSHNTVPQVEQDQAILSAVDQRLFGVSPAINSSLTPVTTSLRHHRTLNATPVSAINAVNTETARHDTIPHDNQPYRRIISCLRLIMSRLDSVRSTVSSGAGNATSQDSIPISILTINEWLCLVRTCVS